MGVEVWKQTLITRLLTGLILLASAAPAASQTCAPAPAWTKFDAAGFSALFPSEPPPFTYSDPRKTRPDSYLLQASRCVYFVAALAHRGAGRAEQPALRERFFDRMQGDTLDIWKKAIKANFIYRRDTSLGAHRGRELSVDSPRYGGVMRMYLTGRRFYAVTFFRFKDAPTSSEGERFLDSFRIDES